MVETVAIIGAGGKMGARAVERIGNYPSYRVLMCESNAEQVENLQKKGFTVIPLESAVGDADFVIMAVPDAVIGQIVCQIVPHMKKEGTLIMLDAAAAYVGQLPEPRGPTFMITHPCHPPFFTEQATPEARRDYFGGIALQDILVSLIHGSETNLQAGTELCKIIFSPVRRVHYVTPEQFALLEPAMSEIVGATAACLMKAALDTAIEKGVPREAAEAFMAGHGQIALAIAFGAEKSPFSDACQIAIQWGTKELINPNWKKVFEPEVLRQAIRVMLHSNG